MTQDIKNQFSLRRTYRRRKTKIDSQRSCYALSINEHNYIQVMIF